MKIISYIFFSLFISCVSLAQTGPGGVGNSGNNGIWLRAGDLSGADGSAVGIWADFSSFGNNAAQTDPTKQPQFFNTSLLNNQPVVRFDGGNDEMAILDNAILDNSGGITYYAVIRPNNLNGAARGILGKRVTFTVSTQYAYTWFFWSGNRLNNDVHTQNNRYNSGSNTFSNATNYILSFDFDGSLPISQRSRMFSNGVKIAQANESSTALPNSNQDVALGALNVSYGTYLGADYAEVIHYNYSLDSSEHIIVSNYLAAKYGVILGANDLYDEDDPGNGNYDFQVAGIGRINASILHSDSQGDGMVRINNPSNLDDNEFMIWGHDNQLANAYEYSDIPPGMQARFNRVWRVSEVNTSGAAVDVGSVDMTWDLNALGPITASDLRLLIDTDNDGQFSDETAISGAIDLGGNLFQFAGVNSIANNNRFTIGTINSTQTPLPVELLYFEAEEADNFRVKCSWETASEINNDYFTIERSKEGLNWEVLDQIDGAGNSGSQIEYEWTDPAPYTGVSYYRLRQTDFNGDYSYSDIRSVDLRNTAIKTKVYPNPTQDQITLEGNANEFNNIEIYNFLGQEVSTQTHIHKISEVLYEINLKQLPEGTYLLKLATETIPFVKQ